ncbi:MAG TPA: hypothetical protein VFK32_07880 [Tepidiformaceae bacterium]|nr:hypothetical protein [Tepidiformaceae bacterium]
MIPVLMLVSACGSSGDDSDAADSNGDDNGSSNDNGSGDRDNDRSSGGGDVPRLDDGAYLRGSLHIKVSGDEDLEEDLEGNAFSQGGFSILTFGSSTATVILGFNPDSPDDPGAISVTSADVSTAGEWGDGCEISVEESDGKVKGEFSCDDLDALGSSTDDITVDIEGTFTLER